MVFIDFFKVHLQPATMQFNEENLYGFIMQPFNTWTNLAFIISSMAIIFIYYGSDKDKKIIMIPVAGILIGMSSFVYHAQFYFFFQVFDLASMFILVSFLVSYNLMRLKVFKAHLFYIFLFSFFAVQLIVLLAVRGKSGEFIFGIFLVIAVILEIISFFLNKNTGYKYFIIAISVFIASYLIWNMDRVHFLIKPENHFLQFHGIWHILNAVSIFFLYLFYRQFEKLKTGNKF